MNGSRPDRLAFALATLFFLCTSLSAEIPQAVLDLALEPAAVNTNPGPEYSDEQRDFAMIIGIPLIQLLLFGFAINTDPKHLPTALLSLDELLGIGGGTSDAAAEAQRRRAGGALLLLGRRAPDPGRRARHERGASVEGERQRRRGHPCTSGRVCPPSTVIDCPVMKEDAASARNAWFSHEARIDPLASLTTVTVMFDPSRFALTSTPSMGPSSWEVTFPVSARGAVWDFRATGAMRQRADKIAVPAR